jgi:Ca2+-transporting ATPase
MEDQTQQEAYRGKPWAEPYREVLQDLEVDPESGLTDPEVEQRLQTYGPNKLREAERRSALVIFFEQFQNIIVLLLGSATVISFLFGETVEGLAILAVILINALLGFFTELRAVRSMEALRELGKMHSRVLREGGMVTLAADRIVPGDILTVESGDVITADARLLEASRLQVDESALTGESVPVGKTTDPIEEDTPLAERGNMVYKGTAVTRGSGRAVVTSTGMETELGEISSLVEEAEEERTPLEKRLDELGGRLVWITLGIAALLVLVGLLVGRDLFLILETSIALAVAAVPEGLPIVATIALASGMRRMAERNALVRQLSAVETLGSTTVILTDKTGTLTENEMTWQQLATRSGEVRLPGPSTDRDKLTLDGDPVQPDNHLALKLAFRVSTLCSNAELHPEEDSEAVGDPLEIALLEGAHRAGYRRKELLETYPEEREIAFDPEIKMMATVHRREDDPEGGFWAAVKGAPEEILRISSREIGRESRHTLEEDDRRRWRERIQRMAAEGFRVIALGERELESPDEDPYQDLTFLGVAGLIDPAREDVQGAIDRCQGAGVEVVMVTGDKAETARTIASQVAMVSDEQSKVVRGQELTEEDRDLEAEAEEADIFARVNPGQKLNLVSTLQENGQVVAMTGDGVNDAPALKKADIGIAMGRRGTQVAQQAADMVLKDDSFATIAVAIEQGRNIFNNIRKFAIYLLSCNASEILVVSLASLTSLPLPIRPLQILYLNLVTDVFPALALGVGEGTEQVMHHPPRDPDESVLTRDHWLGISAYSTLIGFSVLGSFILALRRFEMDNLHAVTVGFLTLAFAQLWHVFNMRSLGTRLVRNEVTTNPYVWGALGLCIGLLLAAVHLPFLSDLLGTTPLSPTGWGLTLSFSLLPLVLGQLLKALGWGRT